MQTREEITTNLVERLDWRVAQREESRVARRLWKKQPVDAISSLAEGALLDEFSHFLDKVGILSRWHALQITGRTPPLRIKSHGHCGGTDDGEWATRADVGAAEIAILPDTPVVRDRCESSSLRHLLKPPGHSPGHNLLRRA